MTVQETHNQDNVTFCSSSYLNFLWYQVSDFMSLMTSLHIGIRRRRVRSRAAVAPAEVGVSQDEREERYNLYYSIDR